MIHVGPMIRVLLNSPTRRLVLLLVSVLALTALGDLLLHSNHCESDPDECPLCLAGMLFIALAVFLLLVDATPRPAPAVSTVPVALCGRVWRKLLGRAPPRQSALQ